MKIYTIYTLYTYFQNVSLKSQFNLMLFCAAKVSHYQRIFKYANPI